MAPEISSSKGRRDSPSAGSGGPPITPRAALPSDARRPRCAALACPYRDGTGRGVAQPGSASHWGCGGRWFESSRPDHLPVGPSGGRSRMKIRRMASGDSRNAAATLCPCPRRRRRRKLRWPARIALAILAIPALLPARRADRRADPGQLRIGRSPTRASPSISPTTASTPTWCCRLMRRASTGGRWCPSPTCAECPRRRRLDRVRRRRAAGLSGNADLGRPDSARPLRSR